MDELTGESITPEQRRILALEAKQKQLERQQEEQAKRLSALEQMHRCKDHLRYHFNMPNEKMEYWLEEGMTVDTIAKYQLGYCDRCPTDLDGRPSYTIPVFGRDGETLINIRHRLQNAKSDKYRPHLAGLGQQLFNSQFTTTLANSIIITEGEKKSCMLDQEGFASVGIMGKRAFKTQWVDWLKPFRVVYVILDPDARESAHRLASIFDGRGQVVNLPVKPDDFFSIYKGTPDDFKWFIERSKPATRN